MRDFLYLDTDFLASFMAQENDGLEVLRNLELFKGDIREIKENKVVQERELIQKNDHYTGQRHKQITEMPEQMIQISDLYKETVSKQLSDNAFSYFEKYLSSTNELCDYSRLEVGKYVEYNSSFNFFDLVSLREIYSSDFQAKYKTLNPMDETSGYDSLIEKARLNLYLLEKLLHAKRFMTMDKLLILIDEKHLRTLPSQISLRFESDIKILGKVTRRAQKVDNKGSSVILNLIKAMDDLVFELLKNLGFVGKNEDIYIVTPIAIYF